MSKISENFIETMKDQNIQGVCSKPKMLEDYDETYTQVSQGTLN